MKAVILAGGLGTRLSEETAVRPKPMVEIGGRPILWHVLKLYSAHGINDFIICCGYKGSVIKDYFANFQRHRSDVTFDFRQNQVYFHQQWTEPWKVTLIDTGASTMTGGRIKRVRDFIGDETFCCTYGDGVGDVNIAESIDFHKQQGTLATLTAIQPPGRFGAIHLGETDAKISSFREKEDGGGAWVNGGFFVLEPKVLDYIEGDHTSFEREPLSELAHAGQLSAYRHRGFWQPMDTLRDQQVLEELWKSKKAPWKIW